MEIWKPIRDFPSYDCSSEGRIRNIRTQRIMRMSVGPKGYLRVCLHRNGEQYTVTAARLIAETFLGGQPDMDIRYKDGDKTNIRVDNLYWSNRKHTIRDAFYRGTKKPSRQIPIRVIETGETYDSIRACERATGCSQSEICKYFKGERPHVKGLHFERVYSLH